MSPRERKVHYPSGRRRVTFSGPPVEIMMCGAGWGEPLLTTSNRAEVTCKRCLIVMKARS